MIRRHFAYDPFEHKDFRVIFTLILFMIKVILTALIGISAMKIVNDGKLKRGYLRDERKEREQHV